MSVFSDTSERRLPRSLSEAGERLDIVTGQLALLSDAMTPDFNLSNKARAGLSDLFLALECECTALTKGLAAMEKEAAA